MHHRSRARLAVAAAVLVVGCKSSTETPGSAPAGSGSGGSASGGSASAGSAAIEDALVPEQVTFASGTQTLGGYLYKPAGNGPFPVVVYNHGSEQDPSTKRGQATFFVRRGYVLFVPHRRGHGLSKSAGEYVGDMLRREGQDTPKLAEAHVAQNDDVAAAIAHVSTLPYVDRNRIANIGCSFGGIQALLSAERIEAIDAAVDFAGAAIMWSKNAALRERMRLAARNARAPVLFIQAENDYDIAPTRELSAEMKQAGKTARARIYPPNGTTPEQGHGFCLGGDNPPWGDEVLQFLGETLKP